jgi:hypothetical protein
LSMARATRVASNLDEVVAKLSTITAASQLAAVVQFWVDGLSLPQMSHVGNGLRAARAISGAVARMLGWRRLRLDK